MTVALDITASVVTDVLAVLAIIAAITIAIAIVAQAGRTADALALTMSL